MVKKGPNTLKTTTASVSLKMVVLSNMALTSRPWPLLLRTMFTSDVIQDSISDTRLLTKIPAKNHSDRASGTRGVRGSQSAFANKKYRISEMYLTYQLCFLVNPLLLADRKLKELPRRSYAEHMRRNNVPECQSLHVLLSSSRALAHQLPLYLKARMTTKNRRSVGVKRLIVLRALQCALTGLRMWHLLVVLPLLSTRTSLLKL